MLGGMYLRTSSALLESWAMALRDIGALMQEYFFDADTVIAGCLDPFDVIDNATQADVREASESGSGHPAPTCRYRSRQR